MADWLLFVRAWGLLTLIRVGLRLFPFDVVRRWAGGQGGRPRSPEAAFALEQRIKWAVNAAVRISPGEVTCLPVALAGLVLLRRQGFPAELRIGVAHGARTTFEAHAWVESEGRVMFGGLDDLPRFIPFPSLDGA